MRTKRYCLICGIQIQYPKKIYCNDCKKIGYKKNIPKKLPKIRFCKVCGIRLHPRQFKYCLPCRELAKRKSACRSAKKKYIRDKILWEALTDDEQLRRMQKVCNKEFKKLDLKEKLFGKTDEDTKIHRRTVERRIERRRREIEEIERMYDQDLAKVERLYRKINKLKKLKNKTPINLAIKRKTLNLHNKN